MSGGPIGGNTGLKYFASFTLEGTLTEQQLQAVIGEIQAILDKPANKGKLTAQARLNGTVSSPITTVRIGGS